MKAMLRNMARRWADEQLVKEADDLRRQLIRAEAALSPLRQSMAQQAQHITAQAADLAEDTVAIEELRAELALRQDQIERQADLFEGYRARITELEQTVVTMGAEAVKGVARGVLAADLDDGRQP